MHEYPPTTQTPPPPTTPPPVPQPRPGLWKRCLWGGLALWILTAVVTYATENTTLLPTLILLGSFLVPAVFVLWAYERHGQDFGVPVILGCFLTGGILGVLGASAMEYYLLHPSLWMFLGVGLIEEAVKLAALMFAVRRYPQLRGIRAGLVLGGSVGFGFAAFESAGYAFNAAVTMDGIDLRSLLETEILRGVLAPFGHGLWTAIAAWGPARLPPPRRPVPLHRARHRHVPRGRGPARTVGLDARHRALAGATDDHHRPRPLALRPGVHPAAHLTAGAPLHPLLGGRARRGDAGGTRLAESTCAARADAAHAARRNRRDTRGGRDWNSYPLGV